MTQFKMIAIDLDGTLLCPHGTVTPVAKAAVHNALRAGFLVCFATGRNWTECNAIFEAVDHFDNAVFVGGAMVVDTKNRVLLHRTMMDRSLAKELSAIMESMGHTVLALQDYSGTPKQGNAVDYLITNSPQLNEATTTWMQMTCATYAMVPSLGDHSHEHTIRIGIVALPSEIAVTKAALERRYGDRILVHDLKVPSYGVEVMEIFDPAVNKWAGIQHIAALHNVQPHEIIAIGDDVNDLPMIRNAGLGVAMGNARAEVRAAAKRTIGPNAEEGLANFLNELVASHALQPASQQEGGYAA